MHAPPCRVFISFCAAVLLAKPAAGQRPTFSLVPTNAEFERRCVGGPEDGQACTTTADCERADGGGLHPECVRVCELGDNDGEPCNSIADCGAAGSCVQRCFCNNWVSNPPPFILTEIVASNWSPEGQAVVAYQVVVDMEPVCNAIKSFGDGGSFGECGWHCPGWIFCDFDMLSSCDIAECSARFAALALGESGVVYSEPKYVGALTLVPQPSGCGTVTVPMTPPPGTGFSDANSDDITPLDLENLTIVFEQACPCDQIEQSSSTACTIDARQESEPDGSTPSGWTSVELNMNCGNSDLAPDDFSLREVPGDGSFLPSAVLNNTPGPGWVTVTFPPTQPGVWTCVKRGADDANEVCLGGLPGDADFDGMVDAADLTALVECVSGAESCDTMQCDMDRSGSCGASDLVRAVDLLGGAEAYNTWLGHSLPDCPNPPAVP